jgi:hypothetical protein
MNFRSKQKVKINIFSIKTLEFALGKVPCIVLYCIPMCLYLYHNWRVSNKKSYDNLDKAVIISGLGFEPKTSRWVTKQYPTFRQSHFQHLCNRNVSTDYRIDTPDPMAWHVFLSQYYGNFLCTGGLSYVLFIYLLIFVIVNCSVQRDVWAGGGGDKVNSLHTAREGGGVVRGQSEFIMSACYVLWSIFLSTLFYSKIIYLVPCDCYCFLSLYPLARQRA